MIRLAVLFALYGIVSAPVDGQVIVTAAGRNAPPAPNGTPSLQAPFQAYYFTLDSRGNILVPDIEGHVVHRMTPLGESEVVAGNGFPGFSGDGGPATRASLNIPTVAFEAPNGNIYISEFGGNRIRMVDTNGNISTIAGNGALGFSPDGTPALQAALNRPEIVITDPTGAVVFGDAGNNRVRRIDAGGRLTTIAGGGQAGSSSGEGVPATQANLNWPAGLAYDDLGNLYISDRFNHVIRRVDTAGVIRTFAGQPGRAGYIDGVLATEALLYDPRQLARDPQGRILLTDTLNLRARRIDQGRILTIAGNGEFGFSPDGRPPLQTAIDFPQGIAADNNNNVLVSEERRVRRFGPSSNVQTVAGTGMAVVPSNGTPAIAADIKLPQGVAVDNQGRLLVASTVASAVLRVEANGSITRIAGTGVRGYSGDGGQGASAQLWEPRGIAVAPDGSIVFADTVNHLVRSIAPNGVITTIAGNRSANRTEAGVPARQYGLSSPQDVALHPITGEVYIASTNHHQIVRIDGQGLVRIVGGTGTAGFDGDGPALQRQINAPFFMDFDANGNLYFTDSNNLRVRRISPAGQLTTVAGNGEWVTAGDGGPATAASFKSPWGIVVDAQGNVYVSEANGHVIRKFTPGGAIATIAGVAREGSAGDGGPALLAELNNPAAMAFDAAGNLFLADRFNNRVRAILSQPPSFDATIETSGPLSFSARAGEAAPPQLLELRGSVLGLRYEAAGTEEWLSIDPPEGDVPEEINVRADARHLGPGSYQARVVIDVPDANPPSRSIEVTFEVAGGNPPVLAADPKSLTFGHIRNGRPSSAKLSVRNNGAGALRFTAHATSEQGWLQLDAEAGEASAGEPAVIEVTASPGNLPVGAYAGVIGISDEQGVGVSVPVTMTISAAEPKLTLSHAGLTFRAQAGGGRPLPQNVGVLNTGSGRLSWNATARTLSGGARWLRLASTSGTVNTPFEDVSTLEVIVDSSGLSEGDYFGRIDVSAAGNPPETISVLLTVQSPNQPLPPEISPSALIFTGAPGVNPGSQELTIANLGSRPIEYGSSVHTLTADGAWFAHSPEGAVVAPNQPQKVVVNPKLANASPGVLRGSLSFQFSDNTVRSVRMLGIVAPSARALADELTLQNACPPLQMALESSGNRIEARIGEPVGLRVKLYDNCGRQLSSTTPGVKVLANFSNGDPQLQLQYEGEGGWGRNWQPHSAGPQTLTVTLTGFLGFSVAQQDIAVEITEASPLPLVEEGAVLNAASFEPGGRVAPGSLISIFGRQLAETAGVVAGAPFPTLLEDTEVILAGVPLPLLYAAGQQVNAQIPFDLPLNRQVQLLVRRGNALSVEERLTVAAAQPAIFTQNQQGFGQGAIVDGVTFALSNSASPAAPGDVLTAFCTGLGLVDPPTPAGHIAPDSPLSYTVLPVEVLVDGIQADVLFSGLAPRFAGLYQVNFRVPQGVLAQEAAPVTLRQGGFTSPPVTIAVR